MTHPQEQNSEWIEWAGGQNPIGEDEIVEVRFRGGELDVSQAGFWDWSHTSRKALSDIVAYRLHTPTPSSQGDAQ